MFVCNQSYNNRKLFEEHIKKECLDKEIRNRFPNDYNKYDYIVFYRRKFAHDILDFIETEIDKFGFISIFDLFLSENYYLQPFIFGFSFNATNDYESYTAANYGWANVKKAKIYRSNIGYYVLKLPKAVALN